MKKIIGLLSTLLLSAAVQATPISSGLIIEGTTFGSNNAFQFFNNSTDGEQITSITWDLTSIGAFFDSTDTSPGNSSSPITLGSSSSVGHVFPTNDALNGSGILTISFSDFDAGEFFRFGVDTDFLSAPDAVGLNGNQFFGATALAIFSDGSQRFGTYAPTSVVGFGSEVSIVDAVTVPEPATVLLLGLSLCGLGVSRKKKNA
ncbi:MULTISPECIES: PEP-CTERM sorting domain-containing protein [unclassified Agarivorans]|uniref:PEP-CTERM sorting domain-containing protein n=1 Tax=unclassified Agarivorans TaxID=2636026 RepID=UPI0026E28A4D|nr:MULTISPECIES: PEP-CTERM sorting domain-containing protein [unclassified Agarivorans]MDO6683885.1 PEP-CTERM sorting domain-containing protein [Agarivorans sp. 3_MG-2023]MDO6714382.1 PEP-CTERM sorting domain-containing protein [Agarivorans sp. 2_MG-2023]